MGLYEFQLLFGAINYLAMYPTLVAFPSLWARLLFNLDRVHLAGDNLQALQGVFLLLMTVVAPSYAVAICYKYSDFAAVAVFQRVTVLAAVALVTLLVGWGHAGVSHFISLMVLVDVTGGIAHGCSHPQGLRGVFGEIWALSKNTPTTPFNRALRVEAYVGMTFGFMATVYAALVRVKLGIVMSVIATVIPFFWICFLANDPGETPAKCLLLHRLTIAGSLLYLTAVQDFGPLNVVFYCMAGALLVGVVSPYLSAVVAGASALVLYKFGCDYVLSVEGAAFFWMLGWGVVTSLTSYGWLFLFYDEYDDKQKRRVKNTHWQDNILGLFCFVGGAALDKAGFLAPGTVGEPVVYLLPPVTLWFTLETKMLNHIQVGTPFHPSWWVDGDLPRFSPTDWVNATFGIATALITVVLTTYAYYAVNYAVGFSAISFANEVTWKFALAHGILFIWHSGMWMIVASSGIPPIAHHTKPFSVFPPELPAFLQANPHDCIPVHKADLAVGVALLFAGTFALDDNRYDVPVKLAVAALWAYQTLAKVNVHRKGWGYAAPVHQKKD